jgi:flagellin-specific chaperone FliS
MSLTKGHTLKKRLDSYVQPDVQWTRIETLLAAYDGMLSRLEAALPLVEQGNMARAQPLLLTSQRLVLALYEGLDLRYGEMPANMQKLYMFVLSCIGLGQKFDVPAAIKVLKIIQSGLIEIKDKAIELERSGQVPPVTESPRILRQIVA